MGLVIALIVVGYLMLIAEIFLPGGIVGTIGAIFVVVGIVLCFQRYGGGVGLLASVGSVVFITGVFYYGIRTFRSRVTLMGSEKDHSAADPTLEELLGKEGVAESTLRPVGIANIAGRRVDVTAEQDFIEPGERIKVVKVEWNRVVVCRLDRRTDRF